MEHASSSPFLLSDVCDSHDVSCIKTSTSVGGLSNLLSALETSETPSEKTTETLICNEPEATEAPKAPEASEAPDVGMNEVDKESEEKEKTPMFENIWASPEGSNGDNRVRTFPQRKPKVVNAPTLKELQDEPTDVGTSDVRKSEPTPVSDPSTPNKSESELVAFWNSAVAVVSTQNFENLWGNRTENRVRKYSPQRPRTVISTSKALLPVVHRNALSPPPSLRLKALPPEMFSLQEGEEEEEKEIEAKTPKRTFESPTRRTRDRTPTTSMFSSQIQAFKEVIDTTATDSTDKSSSLSSTVDLPLTDSPVISPAPIIPNAPIEPKSTQMLQKPSNPRRRLSEPLIEALP